MDHTIDLDTIIARHRVFWRREDSPLPMIGVYPDSHHIPSRFLPAENRILSPEDLDFELLMEDKAGLIAIEGGLDMPPVLIPTWEIPWVETIAGSRLASSNGHLWPMGLENPETFLASKRLPSREDWLEKLADVIDLLKDRVNSDHDADFVVAPGHVRGAADVLAALLGHEELCLLAMDDPAGCRDLLAACNREALRVAVRMLDHAPHYSGGNFNRYGIWAPGGTVVYQEDAAVILSPKLYNDLVFPLDRQVAEVVPYAVLHLHSPCLDYVLPPLLELEELKAVEVWADTLGPCLEELLPQLKKIQERKSLIVGGDFSVEKLEAIIAGLHTGSLTIQAGGALLQAYCEKKGIEPARYSGRYSGRLSGFGGREKRDRLEIMKHRRE